MTDLWEVERSLYEKGAKMICGVDEAGRGPLAGPVCAAAVILPPYIEIPGLNDSKKLTDKRRRELFPLIREKALAYGIAFGTVEEIERVNILQATFLAMNRAVSRLTVMPDFALVDGNRDPGLGIPTLTLVKGDSRSANIAAASILAKVTRDDLMLEAAKDHPGYGFEVHKGYGTKAHYEAIGRLGPSGIHRMSFLKKYYGEK